MSRSVDTTWPGCNRSTASTVRHLAALMPLQLPSTWTSRGPSIRNCIDWRLTLGWLRYSIINQTGRSGQSPDGGVAGRPRLCRSITDQSWRKSAGSFSYQDPGSKKPGTGRGPGPGGIPGSARTAMRGRSPRNPLVRAGSRAPALARDARSGGLAPWYGGLGAVAAVFVACGGEDSGHLGSAQTPQAGAGPGGWPGPVCGPASPPPNQFGRLISSGRCVRAGQLSRWPVSSARRTGSSPSRR